MKEEEGRGETQEGDEEELEKINGKEETQIEEEEEEDGWELETALGASQISFATFSSSIRSSEGSSQGSSSNSSSQILAPSSQDSNTSDNGNDDGRMPFLPKVTWLRSDSTYCPKNVRLWQLAVQGGMDFLEARHHLDMSPYHEGKKCKHCYGKTKILKPDDPDYYDFEDERKEAERLKSEKAAGQQQS